MALLNLPLLPALGRHASSQFGRLGNSGLHACARLRHASQDAFVGADKLRILEGLRLASPRISHEFLYDDRGSELYTQIVQQKEYYLPMAETQLLQQHKDSIAEVDPDARKSTQVIIELGAGDGHRTFPFVERVAGQVAATVYAPCDISEAALRWNQKSFEELFRGRTELSIVPCVGTHECSLAKAASIDGHRTYMFMGSNLGNLSDSEITSFLQLVVSRMFATDRFLIGIDRAHGPHKPMERIEAAYNDAAGVTAAFTLNALSCVNRVASLDFCEDGWRHVAKYDEVARSIITHVKSLRAQAVHTEDGQLLRAFNEGDQIFMERSRKFELSDISSCAIGTGLVVSQHWSSNDYMIVELRCA